MKRLAHIYLVFFPYLFALTFYWLLVSLSDIVWLVIAALLMGLCCILGVAAVIAADIISCLKMSPREASVWNLVIKVAHLPVHLGCYLLFLGMLNPFLMMVSWVPLLLSICLQGFSGFAGIGMHVGACRKGILKPCIAVLSGFLSFLYVLDLLVAIIMVVVTTMARKKSVNEMTINKSTYNSVE